MFDRGRSGRAAHRRGVRPGPRRRPGLRARGHRHHREAGRGPPRPARRHRRGLPRRDGGVRRRQPRPQVPVPEDASPSPTTPPTSCSQIFQSLCDGGHYLCDADAKRRVGLYLESQPRVKGFGNGRLVRNLFEDAVARQASRVVEIDDPTDIDLVMLLPADIPDPPPLPDAGTGARALTAPPIAARRPIRPPPGATGGDSSVAPVKRVLAVVAAVLMIGGALLIRSRLDAREDAAGAPGVERRRGVRHRARRGVRRGPARAPRAHHHHRGGQRHRRQALGAPASPATPRPIDAWLVPRPFPAMVDENRSFTGLEPVLGDSSPVLARSPMTVVAWNDRLDALRPPCGGGPGHLGLHRRQRRPAVDRHRRPAELGQRQARAPGPGDHRVRPAGAQPGQRPAASAAPTSPATTSRSPASRPGSTSSSAASGPTRRRAPAGRSARCSPRAGHVRRRRFGRGRLGPRRLHVALQIRR